MAPKKPQTQPKSPSKAAAEAALAMAEKPEAKDTPDMTTATDVMAALEAGQAEADTTFTLVTPEEATMAVPEGMTAEDMLARIAQLEGQLAAAKIAAPQGVDTKRKNKTDNLVQRTISGNVRTTVDPASTFVAETNTMPTIK